MEDLPSDSKFEEAPGKIYAVVACFGWGVGFVGSFGAVLAVLFWVVGFGAVFGTVVAGFG